MSNTVDILVVDDEDQLRGSIVEALQEQGYNVAQAADGRDGLALAFAEHPKLIFLDYNMPVMDGQEFLVRLRSDEWGKEVEVVYSTNSYETDVINEALSLGVHDYMLKSDVSLEQITQLAQKYVPIPPKTA
tara:strand:- start:1036 stop:1428 length:393 start_codon:yes stop_codon:yes gene_type:complete